MPTNPDDLLLQLDDTAGSHDSALALARNRPAEWLLPEERPEGTHSAMPLAHAINGSEYITSAAERTDTWFAILHTPGGWIYWRSDAGREELILGLARQPATHCAVESAAGRAALDGVNRLNARAAADARSTARPCGSGWSGAQRDRVLRAHDASRCTLRTQEN